MELIHINNDFNEQVKNYKEIVVVDFWANWCGPCKMFSPIFENVANKLIDIKFCKLDVDNDLENISKEYGVMSIPTIILFKNGIEIKRHTGFLDEDSLIHFLEKN